MRVSDDRVLRVRAQLTERDLLLLQWLADHKVLTTSQVAAALFSSLDVAQRRLLHLHQLALVDRFRPLRAGGGSYPWHYVLAHVGAQFIAASRGEKPPRPGESTDRVRRIATSRALDHQLGVNQFFIDLAGYARTHPPARLERWWSEQQCASPGAFGISLITYVHPDGHGIWAEHGQRVAFFAEYDSGSESHSVLLRKLTGYGRHVHRGGPAWPVLFWLPTSAREQYLHRLLDREGSPVPVATAARDILAAGDSPAQAVWLIHGRDRQPRHLHALAGLGAPAPDSDPPEQSM